ncbi:MAG TPA: mechanosensitive ion channel domain-containing protein [Opitutus sp.]|nr:mechanosensitive ion channel domain-containing protein [Opitutus sp.]
MRLSDVTDRFLEYLPRLLGAVPLALAIMVGAFLLNLLIGRALILLARRTNSTEMDVLPIRHIGRWVVRIVATILILSVFGFQIGGIWAMLSTILGLVAIGFVAVWSLISHTSATMLILFVRPFQIGDDVEFAGEPVNGRVADINFFFTTLVDHEGTLHQIPNNLFFQKTLRRRKNAPVVSLAAQLHSPQPIPVEPPPPPAPKRDALPAKDANAMMMLPDPRSITPPGRPGR